MSPLRSARDISDTITNSGTVNIHLLNGEKRHWCLQKNLLRHHSPYFRKLLQDGTKDETLDGLEILRPSDHMASPQPFELVVQWLYLGVIDDVPDKTTDTHPPYNMFTYIRLWCLCDKPRFDMPALQAVALARMADYHRKHAVSFDAPKVEYVYKHTSPSSPLRELVARDAACEFMKRAPGSRLSDGRFGDTSIEYVTENVEFAVDVLYAIRAGVGRRVLPDAFGESDGCRVSESNDDVFGEVKADLSVKTEPLLTYGFGVHANGVLTPDPTPCKSANGVKDRLGRSSSAENSKSPSKGSMCDGGRDVLTPVKASSI